MHGRIRGLRTPPRSLEYGHLLVHGVDRSWLLHTVHQLDHLEPQYDRQGSDLL